MALLRFLLTFSFILNASVTAWAGISFKTKRLTARTLSLKSFKDVRSIRKLSKLSKEKAALKGLGAAFEVGDFLESEKDLRKARNEVNTHEEFTITMGVFLKGQLIGITAFASARALDYREGLYYGRYAKYDRGRWLEYARFIFPEYQGRGFGKELVDGNLEFAFEQLDVDGVVATAFEDNAVSIATNVKKGFKPASSSLFDEIIEKNERVYFLRKDMYETRACIRALD